MKRSKSSLTQKENKKDIKITNAKQPQKQLVVSARKSPKIHDNILMTERPHTSRNAFQERLTKIRKGFEDLQKNLNWNSLNELPSALEPLASDLTSRKVARRLFSRDSTTKKTPKTKEREKEKVSKKLANPFATLGKESPKNISKYHSCIYQKSLFDLMKIVVAQREEIVKLNSQVRSSRSKK